MVCKRRAAEEGAVSLCKAKFRTCLCPAQQHQHEQAGSDFLACRQQFSFLRARVQRYHCHTRQCCHTLKGRGFVGWRSFRLGWTGPQPVQARSELNASECPAA
mmetsp:Transcript_97059/g.156588  ORF Transcript_97059/g.156588 Transcript_97059/m.156588 type:complete len:103 (-) Transcript_97059:57-365(-)